MSNIIRSRQHLVAVSHSRTFSRTSHSFTSGFGFPCDEHGNIAPLGSDAARANLALCLAGADESGAPLYDLGVETYTSRYIEPTVLRCDCGAHVTLDGFTNTCDRCDADYNHGGMRLAPRSQWGEETGESASDILSADCGTDW